VSGILYFQANDGIAGIELWKSDGTEAGTVRVKDIRPGAGSSSPAFLTNVNGNLFFSAMEATTGTELWKSDGTEAGTTRVKDINAGSGSSSPSFLTAVNGTVFFSALEPTTGAELWKSDGTDAGTVRVKDINAGAGSSSPIGFTVLSGILFFSAFDATAGRELWKSNGTAEGTVLIQDIDPGPGSGASLPGGIPAIVNVGRSIFFGASDGILGLEPWETDGTRVRTGPLQDIAPGPGSSLVSGATPSLFTVAGLRVFFAADDNNSGQELWEIPGFVQNLANVAVQHLPNAAIDALVARFGGTGSARESRVLFGLEEVDEPEILVPEDIWPRP